MRVQALGVGDARGQRAQVCARLGRQRDETDALDEILHVDGRGVAGRAFGGHDMAGPGDVVAQHLEAAFAYEDAAGMAHQGNQRPGIGDGETEMLGCVAVGLAHCGLQVGRDDRAAAGGQGLLDDAGPPAHHAPVSPRDARTNRLTPASLQLGPWATTGSGRATSFQDPPPCGKPAAFRRGPACATPEQSASAPVSLQLGPWAAAGPGRATSFQDPPPCGKPAVFRRVLARIMRTCALVHRVSAE